MRSCSRFLAALACLGLAGCLGADDGPDKCPNGEEPKTTIFDFVVNPEGTPSAQTAVARFLRQQGDDVSAVDFDQADSDAHTASFTYSDGESQLARVYVERFDRGWLVTSYAACPGAL